MAKRSNPNGANQYLLDPRQKLCWDSYVNPKSETFGNATKSAIKAGYTPKTADHITLEDWFVGRLRRLQLLGKAEKVLEEMLDMPVDKIEVDSENDEDGELVVKQVLTTDPALVRIKQDTAKFIASTQGKNEGYSTRIENTGADGKELPQPLMVIENGVLNNNSDKENIETDEENPGNTGRNVSQQNNLHINILDSLSAERQE